MKEGNMSLYEISTELYELLENGFSLDFVDEDGVIDEAKVAERIDSLQLDLTEKVDNIACYIKNTRALAEQIKQEKLALADRQKRLENRVERLEEYLLNCLLVTGQKKVETARNCVKYTTSHPLHVIDESVIPKEFIKFTITKKPDANAIKAAITAGEDVPGAEIGTNYNINIK